MRPMSCPLPRPPLASPCISSCDRGTSRGRWGWPSPGGTPASSDDEHDSEDEHDHSDDEDYYSDDYYHDDRVKQRPLEELNDREWAEVMAFGFHT